MDDSRNRDDPIAELITNYHELNSSVIEELHEEPSPLEFMRYVARNTPFVVRGGAADWPATRTWTVDFLKGVLGDQPINVAVTPAGSVFPIFPKPPSLTHSLLLTHSHAHPTNTATPTRQRHSPRKTARRRWSSRSRTRRTSRSAPSSTT